MLAGGVGFLLGGIILAYICGRKNKKGNWMDLKGYYLQKNGHVFEVLNKECTNILYNLNEADIVKSNIDPTFHKVVNLDFKDRTTLSFNYTPLGVRIAKKLRENPVVDLSKNELII